MRWHHPDCMKETCVGTEAGYGDYKDLSMNLGCEEDQHPHDDFDGRTHRLPIIFVYLIN